MPDAAVTPDTQGEKKEIVPPHFLEPPASTGPEKAGQSAVVPNKLPRSLEIDFNNREPGEKVLRLFRQHRLVNLPWVILLTALLLILVFFLNPVSLAKFFNYFDLSFPKYFLIVIDLWFCYLLLAVSFERFLLWYFNVFIITDWRVVDLDFDGVLSWSISDVPLNRIQEINVPRRGLLESIFDFGDVFVQTAAAENNIELTSVPEPNKIAGLISNLARKENYESRLS